MNLLTGILSDFQYWADYQLGSLVHDIDINGDKLEYTKWVKAHMPNGEIIQVEHDRRLTTDRYTLDRIDIDGRTYSCRQLSDDEVIVFGQVMEQIADLKYVLNKIKRNGR